MSFLGIKSPGDAFVTATTFGLNKLAGEDTMSKIPVLNAVGGYTSDADKQLLAKQQELAAEAKKQQERNAQMRMQALGQSLLAFGPRNAMMAQMFGPQAAFTPEQMAQMANDPGAMNLQQAEQNWTANANAQPIDPRTRRRDAQGINPQVQADLERARANERRKQELMAQMPAPGPGPTPLGPRPAPQQARRF